MTTATRLKAKVDDIQDRVRRLAELGALSDRTKMGVESEIDALNEQLDAIDQALAMKLGKAELRALGTFVGEQPRLF